MECGETARTREWRPHWPPNQGHRKLEKKQVTKVLYLCWFKNLYIHDNIVNTTCPQCSLWALEFKIHRFFFFSLFLCFFVFLFFLLFSTLQLLALLLVVRLCPLFKLPFLMVVPAFGCAFFNFIRRSVSHATSFPEPTATRWHHH